ncbi:MAG: pyridoxal-phosphate dependent enzyme [Acinetobacter sp.]|nr:pyridoxal-phosphate dependent enzyme [Acinetobacter sp.]
MFDEIAKTVNEQHIEYLGVPLTIKRLDQIHPQISGNKFFKLRYNFQEAQQQGFKNVLTFGGAYSNHIAATAFAAHQFGFNSVGIIRGEELKDRPLNPTLATAQALGMQLHFISRTAYREKDQPEFLQTLSQQFPSHYVIPEGGTNQLAIQGCKEILTEQDQLHYDVICCAVGTGGTMTGLIEASHSHQMVIGFSALKGDFLTEEVRQKIQKSNWYITDDFCCGGYAKTTPSLLEFMTWFEQQYQIPLEQVYTAKMLYGVFQWIKQAKFKANQRILLIHTGGLQGKSVA